MQDDTWVNRLDDYFGLRISEPKAERWWTTLREVFDDLSFKELSQTIVEHGNDTMKGKPTLGALIAWIRHKRCDDGHIRANHCTICHNGWVPLERPHWIDKRMVPCKCSLGHQVFKKEWKEEDRATWQKWAGEAMRQVVAQRAREEKEAKELAAHPPIKTTLPLHSQRYLQESATVALLPGEEIHPLVEREQGRVGHESALADMIGTFENGATALVHAPPAPPKPKRPWENAQ